MEKAEGGSGDSAVVNTFKTILSTHPQSKKRMQALESQVPRAMDTKRQAGCPEAYDISAFRSTSRSQYS
jgi:hypothetical protein